MASTSSVDRPPHVLVVTRESATSATPDSPALTMPSRSMAISRAWRTFASPRTPPRLETISLTTVVFSPK